MTESHGRIHLTYAFAKALLEHLPFGVDMREPVRGHYRSRLTI